MAESFVPDDFDVPSEFYGPGFRLEPLGPEHNERDHAAWMSSIPHISATPGMGMQSWPRPMTLEQNLEDLKMHAGEYQRREAFTYTVLDGDDVVGCVYIYPTRDASTEAVVRSWVRADRADLDVVVWRSVSEWIADVWPFADFEYADRDEGDGDAAP